MKVADIMSKNVIKVSPEESVEVAARALAHYNIGALPVCSADGRVCGMVTDRDLVVRCVAANKPADQTPVKQVMTGKVLSVPPDIDARLAAHLMGRQQVRRLPVLKNGRLCGMICLGDIACREETNMDAADALADITAGIRDW